jgi:hypothetical protein
VANIKPLVANDKNGLKVLTLKDLSESSKVNRQPTGKREKKIQGVERNKNGRSVTA